MALSRTVNHRKSGDAHRDAGQWSRAAAAYRKHLDRKPDDSAIWVQYGHALKEANRKPEAVDAYTRATELIPEDADAWTHLAHLHKSMGQYVAAYAAFVNANAIKHDEDLAAQIHQLRVLAGEKHPVSEELKPGTILFAIQDLLIFLKHYVTMSGIQRVQCGISKHIMELDDLESRFIVTDHSSLLEPGMFWEIDKKKLRAVIDYASGKKVEHEELKRRVIACEESATTVVPGDGHTIILLGCFWAHDDTADKFIPAKRNGCRFGAYLYDIIPISHPEYCESGLVRMFSQGLGEISMIADFFMTISDYTRVTFEKFMMVHGGRVVPMKTVPLAHSLTEIKAKTSSWPQALQKIRGAEYVAYVSTIEGRKNHIYVVNVWRELIAQGIKVPDLVFVGRKGWRVNGLIDFLEGTNYLDGRVHFVHDLSDGELNAVYEHSLFTVFTSLVEGWGLPVGESLLHNRLCVASNTTSVPEVGGPFAEYIDPNDVRDGIDKIGRLITDRDYLAARQKNIEDNFVPRGWDEVAQHFVDTTRDLETLPFHNPDYVKLPQGEVFWPRELSRVPLRTNSFKPRPYRLILGGCFYTPEDWGAWMKGRSAELTFQADVPEGTDILVFCQLREAPWERNGSFTAALADPDRRLNQTPIPIVLGRSDRHFLKVRGLAGKNGACRLIIEVKGEFNMGQNEAREFVLGLEGLAWAAADNHAARAEVYESFVFKAADDRGLTDGPSVDPGRQAKAVVEISQRKGR